MKHLLSKKSLIALSVIFTVSTAAAYSQVSADLHGLVFAGANVLSNGGSKTDKGITVNPNNDLKSGWTDWNWNGDGWGGAGILGRLQATVKNEEETVGARVRFQGSFKGNLDGEVTVKKVWAWWKPIPQLRFQIGNGQDQFVTNELVGWGFHANDVDDATGAYHAYGNWTRNGGTSAGYTTFSTGADDLKGLTIGIYPIDGLSLGVGIPYSLGDDAGKIYKHTQAYFRYEIANIGRIALSFVGGENGFEITSNGEVSSGYDPMAFQLSFLLTAVENLGLNIGAKYTLPVTEETDAAGVTHKLTVNAPVAIAVGAGYTISDTIAIKARLATTFIGSKKWEAGGISLEKDDPFTIAFDLLPSFDLSILKLYINCGIEFTGEEKGYNDAKVADSAFGWGFNPYVTKAIGPLTVYGGFGLHSDGRKVNGDDRDSMKINWAIPIGVLYVF